jgi:acetyl-CoA carboxylase biotin carboxyl carrier protein
MPGKDDKAPKGEAAEMRAGAEDKGNGSGVEQIRELYDLMVAEGLTYLEVKDEGVEIRLDRERKAAIAAAPLPTAEQAPASSASSDEPDEKAPSAAAESNQPSISAPLAGVFYRASSPTSASFVKEGDVVEPGQTLCIVEAMKVMNEIKAESRCRIVRIVAENARPVTAGQPLFLVESAG